MKKNLKNLKSLMLTLAITSMFTACGSSTDNSTDTSTDNSAEVQNETQTSVEEEAEQSEQSEVAEFTERTVIDQAGREVTISSPVEKIVSCYYTATSSLIAIGADDLLVGIEMGAENRQIYTATANHLVELPSVGSGQSFNMEETLALNPDVVIMPTRLVEYIPTLEEAGINVIVVSPESDEDLIEMFILLGEVIGIEENVEELVSFYEEKLEEVKSLGLEAEKNVYLSGNSSYLSTATSQMYQHYLIEIAGGNNVTSEIDDSYWATISAEQLINYNPDVWLIPNGASYMPDEIYNDVAVQDITAVQNQEVYLIPSVLEGWDYPTPSAILGVLWTAHILHPDVYTEEMLLENVVEFYEKFYGILVDPIDVIGATY